MVIVYCSQNDDKGVENILYRMLQYRNWLAV